MFKRVSNRGANPRSHIFWGITGHVALLVQSKGARFGGGFDHGRDRHACVCRLGTFLGRFVGKLGKQRWFVGQLGQQRRIVG